MPVLKYTQEALLESFWAWVRKLNNKKASAHPLREPVDGTGVPDYFDLIQVSHMWSDMLALKYSEERPPWLVAIIVRLWAQLSQYVETGESHVKLLMWMLVFTGSTAAVSIQRPQVSRVTGRVWACASDVNHCVCWEPVVLHHWGADIWSFFTHWGVEENHHGPWQEQQNSLRVLLCFVCPPNPKCWVVFISATQGLLWLAGWKILWPEACWQTGAVKQLLLESMGTSAWEMECMHLVLIRVPLFCRYYTREDTEDSVKYISGTILDDRPVRVDFDWGFQEGRQWGRGRSGGQVCCCTSKTYNEFFRNYSQWILPLWN